ncbi:MAG TPA: S8 family peptidase [Nevskiaceae bacterium]|nr:S8 family peptidase [Nevskiaceae bacterium]
MLAAISFGASAQLLDQQGPPQRIIVKFKEDHAQPDHLQRVSGLMQSVAARLAVPLSHVHVNGNGADVMKIGRRLPAAELNALINEFKHNPAVEYAEEDRIMHALFTPNDTRYNEQWQYFEANGGLRLPAAWDLSTGSGVVVAVIDTGYRPHADLVANIVGGYDFISDTSVSNDGDGRDADAKDPGDWYSLGQCGAGAGSSNSSWHGTHVAGTIAAVTNNANGVAGVAYNAKVLPARVLGKCGGYTSDIADAITWASGGTVSGVPANPNVAKVLSLSLGGSGACDTTTQTAINGARSRGSVFIVAAGNENQNASNSSPANCTGAIVVAAVGRNGGKASYSNYGAIVDIAAPGGDQTSATDPNGILSTLNAGTQGPGADSYAFYQGTSMATPHVSGVAALMIAKTPGITPDQIEATLKSTARAFPATCSQCGAGIVDANAALGGVTQPPPPPPGPTVLANGVAQTNLSGATGAQLQFQMAVPAGATGLKFVMSGGTGDADMYVKFGSMPTTSSYDCRPYVNGNAETCTIATAQAGTYYVMLNGYSAFSGVSLTGSYSTGGGGGGGSCAAGYTAYTGSLTSGANYYAPSSSGFTGGTGTYAATLTVPAGADFDLYLYKLSGSTWSSKASSTGTTSSESISYSGTSGTYRWRVYSYSGSGSFTLCEKHP